MISRQRCDPLVACELLAAFDARMARVVVALCIVVSVVCSGCGGATPDPREMAKILPPARAVDPERRAALDADVAAVIESLSAREFAAARAKVQLVLEYDPRHARARAVLGHTYLLEATATTPPALEPLRIAEGEMLRATRIDPTDPVVARFHVGLLVVEGHLSAAKERVTTALAAAADDADLLELAGRIHFDLGEERAAAPLLRACVERRSDDVASWWRLAQCHARSAASATDAAARTAEFEAAAAAFARYRELVPEDADAALGEAWARTKLLPPSPALADIEPVLALYDAVARQRPSDADPHFGRGRLLLLAGAIEEGHASLRTALALDPRHVGALLELAASLAADPAEHGSVRDLYERACTLDLEPNERRSVEAWLKQIR
jgi:tetratricopeptide (TPR) repeat protein